ncbi:hypothetical protein F5X99DRAFT_405725 [Biscogniauxia marginata]|nr:hypothetical protein F5X99DRAFT_405725 [Biscogniauxia marginata]
MKGLARRVKPGNPIPWMVQLSGSSNLADHPLTQTAHPDREWDDTDATAIYEFLRSDDEHEPYPQRTAEVAVLTAAEETGVQAASVDAPCVIGTGTGLFNKSGYIIPALMGYVVHHGYGFTLNETANFGWVHVEDLADLYVLLLRAILECEDRGIGFIPSGKSGIISAAVEHVLVTEMVQSCLDTAFDAGVLPREGTSKGKEIRGVSLQEIADEIMGGVVDLTERCWASHKVINGTVAKKLLGWNPTRLDEAWRKDCSDVLNTFKGGRKSYVTEIPTYK